MNFCPACGKPLTPGAPTCGFCGASIAPGAPAAQAFQPVPSAAAQAPASGLTPNAAGALAYLAGFITGIIFLVLEPIKRDPFVRFHAFQSIFFNVAWIGFWIVWTILGLMLSALTKGLFFFIQTPIDLVIMLGGFCLWAFLMYQAYQGKTFKLPIIGALAAKQAGL
jgi:uncharacterized membrane protein